MKTAKFIAKLVLALAAIAGAVYVIATYGNQIVAWCKKVLASLPCCCNDVEVEVEAAEEVAEDAAEQTAEEVVAEEAAVEAAEEAPVEEAAVAEEQDFQA